METEHVDYLIGHTVNSWLRDKNSDRMRRLVKMFERWQDPKRYNLLEKPDYISLCSEAYSVDIWTIDNIEKLLSIAYRFPSKKRTHLFNEKLKQIEKMYWSGHVDDKICKEFISLF